MSVDRELVRDVLREVLASGEFGQMPAGRLIPLNHMTDLERELRERLAVAEEALRFYADESNYDGWAPVFCEPGDGHFAGACEYDKGRQARSALSRLREDGEPCTECDGKGHYTGWPHTTCPACKGKGRGSYDGGQK